MTKENEDVEIEKANTDDTVDKNYITAQLNKVIYPNSKGSSTNGFTVIDFICVDKKSVNSLAVDENGYDLFASRFKATGYYLPDSDMVYKLYGHWKNTKYGRNFEVERYEEVIEENEAGIINYLSTLDGIGIKTATRIYDKFEGDSLRILDEEPEKLLEVRGISEKLLDKVVFSYNEKRGAQEVVVELAPLGFTTKQIYKMYSVYKADTIDTIKNNPFLAIQYIGYERSNALAVQFEMPLYKRIVETMIFVLNKMKRSGALNTVQGSVFMDFENVVIESQHLLKEHITNSDFEKSIGYMKERGIVFDEDSNNRLICYREDEYKAEKSVANSISRLLRSESDEIDIEEHLSELEETSFRLVGQQEEAVFRSLKNNFSIITGGPGTGKTTIINFIVNVYKKAFPNRIITLLAPTGRAAKKMSESTDMPATTIHKALSLTPMDDTDSDDIELDSDLVIVDETSMVDIHLANVLLKSIKTGAKVIFVGDVDQLPSIGPGSFLNDLIESKRIPVTKLTKIYRVSNSCSNIITNANLIKLGQPDLDYVDDVDGDFRFVYASNFSIAQKNIISEYLEAVADVGIDEVCLLSPFRTKTDTGVDQINPILQQYVNPPSPDKKEFKLGSKIFRQGDKVMETVNKDDIANGDIGYIISIDQSGDDTKVIIDFNDSQIVEYDKEDMEDVVLAYATTIHKSQGSEYKTVIINLMDQHSVMLKRNLIYTAVTRAKDKCIIIGTKTAIRKSILDESMQFRNSKLIERIQDRVASN